MTAVGGSGTGLAQDATLQAIIAALGGAVPDGGSGTGLAQDASLQALYDLIAGGGGGLGGPFAIVNIRTAAAQLGYTVLGNGVNDDTAGIQAVFTAFAGTGVAPWFPGGTATTPAVYVVSSPITVPSKFIMWGDPGAVIKSTITPSGGPGGFMNSVFYAVAAAVVGGFSSTLAANAVAGSNTISTNAKPAVGIWIEIISTTGTANVAEIAQVRAAAGAGPYTVTLDRPVQRAQMFPSTSQVVQVSPPLDIRLFFNRMLVSGTGDRAIEFGQAQRCIVDGLRVDQTYGQFTSFVCSFDIGSSDCVWRDLDIDGGLASGPALECAYRCVMDNVRVQNTAVGDVDQAGIILNECVDCDVLAFTDECGNGVLCTVAGTGDIVGTKRTRVRGSFNSSNYYGALVQTQDVDFLTADFSYNASGGVNYSSVGSSIVGGPTRFLGCRSYGNTGPAITTQSDIVIQEWNSLNDSAGIQWNGGKLDVRGGDFGLNADTAAYTAVTLAVSGGVARFNGTRFPMISTPGHNEIVFSDVSTGGGISLRLVDVQINGSTYGIAWGLGGGTTSTSRIGSNVILTGTTIPYYDGGGNHNNRKQTVVANGTTGVPVVWPDIIAEDVVLFTEQTPGGTPGHPTYTITPGTGFTLVSTAADTSTYEYFLP
jgi:hypothetical protein